MGGSDDYEADKSYREADLSKDKASSVHNDGSGSAERRHRPDSDSDNEKDRSRKRKRREEEEVFFSLSPSRSPISLSLSLSPRRQGARGPNGAGKHMGFGRCVKESVDAKRA